LKNLVIFILPFLFACTDSKWEKKPADKFLAAKKIDTTQYSTLEELFLKGVIRKITTSDSDYVDNHTHFSLPLVYDRKYDYNKKYFFIEKKYIPDDEKIIIIKYDEDAIALDSIVVDQNTTIINSYIIEKDTYNSWLIDCDKRFKKIENINYFSESDTSKIKAIVKSLKRNNESYYSTSEYTDEAMIDTCNYIISFKNNKLIKYNYLKKFRPEYELKLGKDNTSRFSSSFSLMSSIKSEDLFQVDNFFAKYHYSFIPGNKWDFKLYPNGGGVPQCDNFMGTVFFSLLTTPQLKIKVNEESICEKRNLNELGEYHNVYTEDFLNFYLIEKGIRNPVYYVVKKVI